MSVSQIFILDSQQEDCIGLYQCPGAWIFPAPVIGDHLLTVPPVAGLEGVHRVAELLEHDVRVQTVGGGPAGEIATPQHRVEASRRGPVQLGGHIISFDCQIGGQRSL